MKYSRRGTGCLFSLAAALVTIFHICTVAAIFTGQRLALIDIFLTVFTPEMRQISWRKIGSLYKGTFSRDESGSCLYDMGI